MRATSVRSARSARLVAGVVLLLMGAGDARPGATASQSVSTARTVVSFDAGWRFSHADVGNAAMPALDDSAWRVVDLPHDWSAEGPFAAGNGSGNGYAPGGIGWYRKHFTLDAALAGKIATLEFDGVYDHAEVWVNGQLACSRPYGYSSFECPLTPYVRFGSAANVVSVRVDHSRFADSRWYTGSGIYRHVRLRVTDPLRIGHGGTFITTPAVSADAATVRIETLVENGSDRARAVTLESEILLGDAVVARVTTPAPITIDKGGRQTLLQNVTVAKPRRWTLDDPALYTLRQRLTAEEVVVDDAETAFGVRTTRFDPQRGFFLNDEPVKLKGVCVHHDAGGLGAAVPAGVWVRRLLTLKALGVNAIRTSHNPPAPEFLDLCDQLGLLVKDEAFDEFTPTKNKWVSGWNAGVPSRFGYGESFTDWSVIDASDMVRRDRNHPSVIAWSVGNEVDYPNDPFSHPVLGSNYRPAEPAGGEPRHAGAAADRRDPRARSDEAGDDGARQRRDVRRRRPPRPPRHRRLQLPGIAVRGRPRARPDRVIFGSENSHTYANWTIVRDNPYVAGQFLWTGIDYLGEAGVFPNRANGAGLLDLAGFKKPMAWFRQSLWSATPMVYMAASVVPAADPAGNSRGAPPCGPGRGALELAGRIDDRRLGLHERRGRHAHAERSVARHEAAGRGRRRRAALGCAVPARRAESRGALERQAGRGVHARDGRRRGADRDAAVPGHDRRERRRRLAD